MSAKEVARYHRALHAMQSGVATEMQIPNTAAATEPKHLRVGLNSTFISHAAIAKLLLDKGVITQDELDAALADAAESEVAAYEHRLTQYYERPVKFA